MDDRLLTVADYEARAKEIMPAHLYSRMFGWYGAPTWDGYTNNLAALERIKLRPRVLVDVSKRDLSTEVVGQKISLPVMFAPTGGHTRTHDDGELASARGAGAAGSILTLSTAASFSIEDVAKVATGPLFFQVYIFRDRRISEILIKRAEKAGYQALVVTVDNLGAVYSGHTDRYEYGIKIKRVRANFVDLKLPDLASDLQAKISANQLRNDSYDNSFTWGDLDWVRSLTKLPIIVKGIQTGADARLCLEHGVQGIVVSNHGGHDVDAARAPIDALPEVADAVGGRAEIYMDGGIRKGTDILKALALGARAVFVGRPMHWGLAVNGADGAAHVLELMKHELDVAMGMCGVPSVRHVSPDLIDPNSLRRNEETVKLLKQELTETVNRLENRIEELTTRLERLSSLLERESAGRRRV